MIASDKCLKLIAKFEGLRLKPYLDAIGVPTIGYGNTYYLDGSKVTMKDKPISKDEAWALLQDHVDDFITRVDKLAPGLNENQLSALTSFAYNVGLGNLKKSTLLKKVKANKVDPTIKAEFLKWDRAGGKVLPGLTKRRVEESELYFKPVTKD